MIDKSLYGLLKSVSQDYWDVIDSSWLTLLYFWLGSLRLVDYNESDFCDSTTTTIRY